jgi:hypothetical protein
VVPRVQLGTLSFATQFLDELWPILLLAGVETVRVVPGLMAANPLDFVSYPWSHSLLMAVVWGALIGGVYWSVRKYGRGALVVGLLVASHWILDLPMHRPDLQLAPGVATRVGLGLWNSVAASIVVEMLVFGVGIVVYLRTTRAVDRVGSVAFWAMVVVLLAIYLGGFAGSPPPTSRAVAIGALGLWLFVPWSWWIDRHRVVTVDRPSTRQAAKGGSVSDRA